MFTGILYKNSTKFNKDFLHPLFLKIVYNISKKSNLFFSWLRSHKIVLIEVTEPVKYCINRGYEA